MRERNFARARVAAASNQRDAGRSVVRRAKRSAPPVVVTKSSGERMHDRGRSSASSSRHRRKQSTADDAPASTCRFLEDRPSVASACRQRQFPARVWRAPALARRPGGGQRVRTAAQRPATGPKRFAPARWAHTSSRSRAAINDRAVGTNAASDADAAGNTKARPSRSRRQHHRQRTANRAQLACQRKLARQIRSRRARRRRDLPARSEYAERDRQIETAGLLGQVGGGKIDRDAARREFELRVLHRSADAVSRFAHFGFGQTHDVHPRQSAGEMHLDGNQRRFNAGERAAVHDGNRHGGWCVWCSDMRTRERPSLSIAGRRALSRMADQPLAFEAQRSRESWREGHGFWVQTSTSFFLQRRFVAGVC